ncbi:MAG TPA: hypothetical protein VHL57_02175, partial [Flavobacteriales bacterium]|nr:hypothetical protein [Flavobacteriales bacterium]
MAAKHMHTEVSDRKDEGTDDILPRITWWLVLLVLAIVMLNATPDPVEAKKDTKKKEGFTLRRWWDGTAQEDADHRLATKSKLAAAFTPKRKELDMRLFDRLGLQDNFFGEDHYVFSASGLASYLGSSAIGPEAVKERVRQARVVQDSLDARG